MAAPLPLRIPVLASMNRTLTTWGQLLGSLCERSGWSQPCSWQPVDYTMKTPLQVALIDAQVGNLREFRSWMNVETALPSWPSQWTLKNRAEGKTHGQGRQRGFAWRGPYKTHSVGLKSPGLSSHYFVKQVSCLFKNVKGISRNKKNT